MRKEQVIADDLAPPTELTDAARARWVVVAPFLAQRGSIDRERLSTYCQVYARWRQAEAALAKTGQLVKNERGRAVPNPLVALSNQAAGQVQALEKRLGLDPVDRPAPPTAAGALLTRRDLARVLGVHMQTICKWEQDGLPIAVRGRKGKPSRYRETDARAWLKAREDAAKLTGVVDVAQERARKERAQAVLAEQTFQIRQRDLLPKSDVERIWSAEQAAVRTKLLAIPAAYADRLHRAATLEGVVGVEQALKDAVYDALRELADADRAPWPPGPHDGERKAAA